MVLVKPEHQRRISHVHTSSVKTGIANTLGREGMGLGDDPEGGDPWAPPELSGGTSLQGTRELWASPSFSMGPHLASSIATWPLAARRPTGDAGMGRVGLPRGRWVLRGLEEP